MLVGFIDKAPAPVHACTRTRMNSSTTSSRARSRVRSTAFPCMRRGNPHLHPGQRTAYAGRDARRGCDLSRSQGPLARHHRDGGRRHDERASLRSGIRPGAADGYAEGLNRNAFLRAPCVLRGSAGVGCARARDKGRLCAVHTLIVPAAATPRSHPRFFQALHRDGERRAQFLRDSDTRSSSICQR